jgi:hypothetical protein
MNFIFGDRAKCHSDLVFRISARIQNVAALHENRAPIGRNAKSFMQAIAPNLFVAGNEA